MTTAIRLLPLMLVLALAERQSNRLRAEDAVADRLILRDDTELLGQIVPASPRSGRVEIIVRRSWIEVHFPDQAERWAARDRPNRLRAISQRVDRLRQWQQDRRAFAIGGQDPIAEGIEAELQRLANPDLPDQSPLMVIGFPRGEVARVVPQPESRRRMLRQGWRAGFEDVESMPEDRLASGLRDRGFAAGEIDPAPIDDLLPVPLEDDRRWLSRRASTEVLTDPGLHLIRFGDLVLPEPSPGMDADPGQMIGAVGGLLDGLLGGGPVTDPMRPHLDRIESSGRVGVVVTRLETSPGFDRVAVEAAVLIRTAPGRWEPASRRRAEVRPADLPADAGRPLAEDPQVRAAFGMLQGLGLGQVDPGAQRMSLAVGAASQRALAEARSALENDLRSVAIRFDRGAGAGP